MGDHMKRFLGWGGLTVIGLIGAARTFGILYLFAPWAPFLWAVIVVPLVSGGIIAAVFSRLVAGPAGITRRAASLIGAVIAILPMSGLIAAMLVSPLQPQAQPGPDPRGAHRLLKTTAGSSIAWWSIEPEQLRHRTPVIFVHGEPGSFSRNRDFDVAQGFRDAGFTTLFYDQAGSGASGNLPIDRYTVANAVADLDALPVAAGADKIVLWGKAGAHRLPLLMSVHTLIASLRRSLNRRVISLASPIRSIIRKPILTAVFSFRFATPPCSC